MMYNKRMYRKLNDKKVLHKVHKKWVVVTAALLGLGITGAAGLTTGTTHADTVANNGNVQASQTMHDQAVTADHADQPTAGQTANQQSATPAAAQQSNTNTGAQTQQNATASAVINPTPDVNTTNQTAPVQASANNNASHAAPQQAAPAAKTTNSGSTNQNAASNNVHSSTTVTNNVHTNTASSNNGNGVNQNTNSAAPAQNAQGSAVQSSASANAKSVAGNSLNQKVNSMAKSGLNAGKISMGSKSVSSAMAKSNLSSSALSSVHVSASNSASKSVISNTESGSMSASNKVAAPTSSAARHDLRLNNKLQSFSAGHTVQQVNGTPSVDNNAAFIVPNDPSGNQHHQLGAVDTTSSRVKNTAADGNHNNDKKTNDPYEADPYKPVLDVGFADVHAADKPVGKDVKVQVPAGSQFTVAKNGDILGNGWHVASPKGYVADEVGDEGTYTPGVHTVLPRMFSQGAWDNTDYTVGLRKAQPNEQKHLLGAELGNSNPNTVSTSSSSTTGNGGDDSNNNLSPNGPVFNNVGHHSNDDSALAALINNQGRDATNAMDRLQTDTNSGINSIANSAATAASASAAIVANEESGQDATTIASMSNSAKMKSLENSIAADSSENAYRTSAQNSLNGFAQSMDAERAGVNSTATDALDDVDGLSNLNSDEYYDAMDQLQQAESDYLNKLSTASSPEEWQAITSDFEAKMSSIMSKTQNLDSSEEQSAASSADATIDSDTTKVNDIVNSDAALTDAQRTALESAFNSDKANAQAAATKYANNPSAVASIVNSLNSDFASAEDQDKANDTSNSAASNSAASTAASTADSIVNNDRNNEINSVNNNPNLSQQQKAEIDSDINARADEAIKNIDGGAASGANAGSNMANTSNAANTANVTPQSGASIAQASATNQVNTADNNDKGYINNDPWYVPTQRASMDSHVDSMASSAVDAIDNAASIPQVDEEEANATNDMAKYSGNLNNEAANNNNGNNNLFDPNNMNGMNGWLNPMNPNSPYNPNSPFYNPNFMFNPNGYFGMNDNFNPYAYDAGYNPYGTGMIHYDGIEWKNEGNLATQYAQYRQMGATNYVPLNNQAFHYGLVDAANGIEGNPALSYFMPYRDGFNSYTAGYHAGEFGMTPANLKNYSFLYQQSYQEAYRAGVAYRGKNYQSVAGAFADGYKASSRKLMPQASLIGHSARYIAGYVKGLNDRLHGHHLYVYANQSLEIHATPNFTKHNNIHTVHVHGRAHAQEFIINGAAVDANGLLRYHVSALGTAGWHNSVPFNGWITANRAYTRDTYYRGSDAKTRGNKVYIIKGCTLHATRDDWAHNRDLVGTFRRGQVVRIKGIVRVDGITRFYLGRGAYMTSNKAYVQWLR